MPFYFGEIRYLSKLLISSSAKCTQFEVFAIHPTSPPGSGLITFVVKDNKLIPYRPLAGHAAFYEVLIESILAKCQEKKIPVFS